MVETDASIRLSRKVSLLKIPNIVDDPHEVRIQSLSWYAQEVNRAFAVIVHFLSQDHTGYRLHNAKNSFVSGIAYGFAKHLLMLAHEPFDSPIDYRELLKTHSTAAGCESHADNWLRKIEQSYDQRGVASRHYEEELRAQSELQQIAIGDPVAEHEADNLLEYFVTTAAYAEAVSAKRSILVGRKGSGKTAILYKLADELGSDPRNHVCTIKPVAYELEGILRMLQQSLEASEKGFLTESFWKFLIYTELGKSVYEALQAKPLHFELHEAERELSEFVEEKSQIITPDFSIRLEFAVNMLRDVANAGSAPQQRAKISELLHEKILGNLRHLLGKSLEKKNRVVILVDNLDKAWMERTDLPELCQLLLGLLSVTQRISEDFQKCDRWRRPVNLSLVLFLRSDIFAQVIKYARERDKISYSRITWDDPAVLSRVLEQRFLASSASLSSPNEVWDRCFAPYVKGTPTRDYITSCIVPRPRDLIILCKGALAQAINRGHAKVLEEDILEAQKRYSQYALDSLLVENGIRIQDLESLLYEFVGDSEVITYDQLLDKMIKSGISEEKLDDVIELLCDLTFLGREVGPNRFEFQHNEDDKAKLQVMARKVVEARAEKMSPRFRVGKAFHAYLEIVPDSSLA